MSIELVPNRESVHLGFAFIIAILLCVILNPLNSSTMSVALPALLPALHTTSIGITWIVSGYYLGSAIAQPVFGKLGDTWGRARFVYIGLFLMTLTAVMAPLSRSLVMFVGWRIVQAIGTSMIYPNAIGLLRQYRRGDIGKVLGWIGMAVGIAVATGPTIGGLLIDVASWHAVFWLNIPLSMVAALLLWRILPRERLSIEFKRDGNRFGFDWAGILLFSSAVTVWLVWSNSKQLFSSPERNTFILSLVLTVMLILIELRQQSPIIPVNWFRQVRFASASLITIFMNLIMYCILYGLPVFLETVRKFSATQSGLVLLAFAGVMSLASPFGGRFSEREEKGMPVFMSSIILLCGILMLCWINTLSISMLILSLALIGISFAVNNVVIQKIVLDSAPEQDTGQASGVYTLLRYVGTILSSVLVGSNIGTNAGAHLLFVVLAGVCIVTVFLTFGLGRIK